MLFATLMLLLLMLIFAPLRVISSALVADIAVAL